MPATPEHATAKIEVWWDMKDCPVPEGYDAGRIRQSIEGAFKEKGYIGPVSITAYGDQTQTPAHILQGLFCTGISVAHTRSEGTSCVMYRDMVEWRGQNPPPATMMIISNQVGRQFSWDLARLQQRTFYNLFLAYSVWPEEDLLLSTRGEWRWKKLLKNKLSEQPLVLLGGGAKFYCKSCNLESQSLKKFSKHLSSYRHALEEDVEPTFPKAARETEDWGRNYKATPEFATAKIQVFWDLFDCPIPQGYDPRQVRPSIEAAFKELGYSGLVSITAYGDHNYTPLEALSSTGIDIAHTVEDVIYKRMCSDVMQWNCDNPDPATLMVISDSVDILSVGLVRLLQENQYNFFLAYSFRPYKLSCLLTSAEWLWESLLAVSEKRIQLLQKCSSGSESGEPTATFYCKLCRFDTKNIDSFRTHLSTDEKHIKEEKRIPTYRESTNQYMRLTQVVWYHRDHLRELKKYRESKQRMKKAIRTGFGFLHNQLLLNKSTLSWKASSLGW